MNRAMLKSMKQLRDNFTFLDKELTTDTPLSIYRSDKGRAILLGLGGLGACLAFSTGVMYLGLLACTYGTPPLPVYLLGLLFSAMFSLGFMAASVTLFMLGALIALYILYLMVLVPLTIGTWRLSLLLGARPLRTSTSSRPRD